MDDEITTNNEDSWGTASDAAEETSPIATAPPPPLYSQPVTDYPAPQKPGPVRTLAIVLISVLIGSVLTQFIWSATHDDKKSTVVNNAPTQVVRTGDIKSILKKVEPAVVAIETRGVDAGTLGAGTGMIVTSDGYVLTNAHVIEGGNSYRVSIFHASSKGKPEQVDADLVGVDRDHDVALIKIRNAKNLPTVTLGKSKDMEVGDPVIAIGNALGLTGDPSVTTGIISAIGRSIETPEETLDNLLQTDAAINFGNSGGPLVNMNGEVIGINTATADPTYSQNIGFALEIDKVKPLIDQLKKGKDVTGGALLGVAATDLSPTTAQQLGVPVNSGALVVRVSASSPANDIGLQADDVIVSVNDTQIGSSAELRATISKHKAGDKVDITWYRGASKHTAVATLVGQSTT